jgi:hypothetical protein
MDARILLKRFELKTFELKTCQQKRCAIVALGISMRSPGAF